ncbi:hypothetical protein [Tropicibacter sp. S64]|uniref:hypothetical protein n=1 Tax=Tropicibacter sp. S64 TaxID=3415122 RepID=UPI003C7A46FF
MFRIQNQRAEGHHDSDSWGARAFHGAGQASPTIVLTQSHVLTVLGTLCIALPVVMVALSAVLAVCSMSSLSHYYYVPIAGNMLVGWLMAIAFTMALLQPASGVRKLVYRTAAVMVVLMAVFPIAGDGCARGDYTGVTFYHFDYAHPETIGVMHHLQFAFAGLHLSANEIHLGASVVLSFLLMLLCFDWQPIELVQNARRYGYQGAVPSFWTLRNVCCLGIAVCFMGASIEYMLDDGWIDGYHGLFAPEMAFQSSLLIFFGAAMLAEARGASERT